MTMATPLAASHSEEEEFVNQYFWTGNAETMHNSRSLPVIMVPSS
jgi:hypothetical protein